MTGIPASDHRIRKAVLTALGTNRSTSSALMVELRLAGIDLGPDGINRLERVLDESTEFIDVDDEWLGVAATLDGTRWMTTVDADGPKQDVLALHPDLA